jgi:hypothetical protein
MTPRVLVLALTAVVATTGLAAADPGHNRIDQREAQQRAAIKDGRRDGSITFLEAWRLRREQARIATLEAKFKRDGGLSPSERRELRFAQDDASRHIYAERHNEAVRGWWWRTFVR